MPFVKQISISYALPQAAIIVGREQQKRKREEKGKTEKH